MNILSLFRRNSKAKSYSVADQIINQAQAEHDRIIEAARKEAADILAKAKIECSSFDREIKWKKLQDEHLEVCDGLSEVHRTLQNVNELLRATEVAVSQEYTQRIFSNLYELYELICDVRDSYSGNQQDDAGQTATMVYNLNEFLDFICDILSVYGIRAYKTEAGESFDGTIHMSENKAFYPKTAKIMQSLRNGFCWRDTVLIKEKVSVRQEE